MSKIALLVVNFGGPRNTGEVPDFLEALLTDKDVIRTPLPGFIQDLFFKKVAKRRSHKVAKDYEKIGGKSPIFEDTEWIASTLKDTLNIPTITFHRYLRDTHTDFLEKLQKLDASDIWVFPLFPQFSYVTTGSIARWISKNVSPSIVQKMHWIDSYATNERFIEVFAKHIQDFLAEKEIQEEEAVLLFSAHGLPENFIRKGDPYQKECEASFQMISNCFSKAKSMLCYQSKFGRGKWLTPSTLDVCSDARPWIADRKKIVLIPLSFTSDHIETLFEIEEEYVQPLREKGFLAFRCPALGRKKSWADAIKEIVEKSNKVKGNGLIRSS